MGDSLTAGYGLKNPSDGFANKLELALSGAGKNITIINAGVSGDTTTAANERLLWALGNVKNSSIKFAIVELGANDAFRAISPKDSKIALQKIITTLKEQNVKILLAGMLAPPNMGPEYEDAFSKIFTQLAKENNLMLYPFFLDGVAGVTRLNQRDGIHPTPEGVDVIVKNILPYVLKLIK